MYKTIKDYYDHNNCYDHNDKYDTPNNYYEDNEKTNLYIKYETKNHIHTIDPRVWGPAFWFTLHNGASKYPISATPITQNKMKGFILGIPIMLPCDLCKSHAINHIEKHKNKLDDICSGREKLFSFFVDFHNIVNVMYNKPIISVEDAYKMYGQGVNITVLSYV